MVGVTLTPTEARALEMYIDSRTFGEAAAKLGVARQSLKNRLAAARRRNGCRTTRELIYRYTVR